jgi:ketosteroid isomerase-like protein
VEAVAEAAQAIPGDELRRRTSVSSRMRNLGLFLTMFVVTLPAHADGLRDQILAADTALFDAFNAHDTKKLASWFTDDLEFYQDTDGLEHYPEVVKDFDALFASTKDIRRQLLKDTVEVYPIKGYGAVEMGSHRFCHAEKGAEDCGTFRFTHVWRKTGDRWQLARVISIDHH